MTQATNTLTMSASMGNPSIQQDGVAPTASAPSSRYAPSVSFSDLPTASESIMNPSRNSQIGSRGSDLADEAGGLGEEDEEDSSTIRKSKRFKEVKPMVWEYVDDCVESRPVDLDSDSDEEVGDTLFFLLK